VGLYVNISGGHATTVNPTSLTLDTEINQGWRGALGFAHKASITFGDVEPIDITIGDSRTALSQDTPPMLARVRKKYFTVRSGWSATFDLIDQYSYRLSTGALSFPTFSDCTMEDIVDAVALACDVPILGAVPTFPVWKEDIKQSDGWGPLRRGAIVSGTQLVVQPNGVHFVEQSTTNTPGAPFSYYGAGVEYAPLDRYGKLFITKNLGMGAALPEQYYDFTEPGYVASQTLTAPLSSAYPYDMSANGYAGWVGFWDSLDRLIAIYPMGGGEADGYTEPLDGVWPAVKFSVWVYPQVTPTIATNVRLRILGIPPITLPSGIDGSIAVTKGTGRGYPQPFGENLIPGLDYVNANYLKWLREINRHTKFCPAQGPFQIAKMLDSFSFEEVTGRIEKVAWQVGGGKGSTSITAEHID
jgi:hypothetical protein